MNFLEEEVTREPFDDGNESVQSPEHDESSKQVTTNELIKSRNVGRSTRSRDVSTGRELSSPAPSSGLSSQSDDITEDEADRKFAKSFGIELRATKTKACKPAERSMQPSKSSQTPYERFLSASAASDFMQSEEGHGQTATRPLISSSVTSDCIYHKGTYYQRGDIVALCDQDDGQVYFAQLTGFLQDQFCEKSAALNWLVPIRPTSREFFDPTAYRIGLEDSQLRKLDCMTFVRHCPHDYYLRKLFQMQPIESGDSAEAPAGLAIGGGAAQSQRERHSFIWTTMRPCRVPSIESSKP